MTTAFKNELAHKNRCTALVGIQHTTLQGYVIHDLFALSSCLREQTPFSALVKIFCFLVIFLTSPSQPSFRGYLPDKMNFYCIRGIPDPLPWLTSDLAHREQYDMVHHHVSSFIIVVCGGFPKALFFCPLLFRYYIIDPFHSSSHLSLILFAYDSDIFLHH